MEDQRPGSNPPLDLLADAVRALEEQGPAGLDALLAQHPAHAGAIRRQLHRLGGLGMLSTDEEPAARLPERLGEFVLGQRLGSGGMGIVFAAEQPSLRRQVALKLIRPEFLHLPNARDRFRREVEAIAGLQHPSIVRVHSASIEGETPFFTMERVDGVSLDRVLAHLRRLPLHRLTETDVREAMVACGRPADAIAATPPGKPRGWVELCCQWVHDLADAADHAHRHGVLHRDVKPSNVMITDALRPMLLDFGLASTQGDERITRSGAQLGSLPYMAPEQVRGETRRIDARTDVYGLGVLLYELLTLVNPFHHGSSSEAETRQRIVAAVPAPVRHHNPGVSWDAETVCHCAMAPEIERRYPTAGSLAQDLANVLHLRPIAARRPGTLLRLRRWVRRHPTSSAAFAMGILLLIATPSAFAWSEHLQHQRVVEAMEAAQQENERAQREAETRADLLQFFREELLASVAPGEQGKDATMRQVLDAASQRIEGRFDARPLVEAEIRSTIGFTYRRLGELEPAERHLRRALELMREHAGEHDRRTLAVERRYVMVRSDGGHQAEEEPRLRANLAAARAAFGEDDPDTLAAANNLGLMLSRLEKYDEALPLLHEVVEKRLRLLGEAHEDTQISMCNLGIAYYGMGRYADAEPWLRRELELCSERIGDDHPETLQSRQNYANLLGMLGRPEEAIVQMQRVVEAQLRVLGEDHLQRLSSMWSLSRMLASVDRHEDSLAMIEDIREHQDVLSHKDRLRLHVDVAHAAELRALERLTEARAAIEPVIDEATRLFGEGARITQDARSILADVCISEGDRARAAEIQAEIVRVAEQGQSIVALAHSRYDYARNLRALDRHEECERQLRSGMVLLQEHSPTDPALLKIYEELKALHTTLGNDAEVAEFEQLRAAWMVDFRQRRQAR